MLAAKIRQFSQTNCSDRVFRIHDVLEAGYMEKGLLRQSKEQLELRLTMMF